MTESAASTPQLLAILAGTLVKLDAQGARTPAKVAHLATHYPVLDLFTAARIALGTGNLHAARILFDAYEVASRKQV